MKSAIGIRFLAWAAIIFSLAPEAWAATPMCNDIGGEPPMPTCTCICEASSTFPGCATKKAGESAPTPNQCPDMLQGRRVLSRGDALVVANPHAHSSNTSTNTRFAIYKTENDTNNPGIGIVDGTAAHDDDFVVPCTGTSGEPFPEQVRFARLFDRPYDMVVRLRPTSNSSVVNSACGPASSSAQNLTFQIRSPNDGTNIAIGRNLNPLNVHLAIDDFDYDGFDDIVFVNRFAIQAVSAKNTANPASGLKFGPLMATRLSSGAFRAPLNDPTTGDFNGDGLKDVAWIGGDFPNKAGTLSVFFATVCPGDITNTLCEGHEPLDIILDPAGAASTIVLDDASLAPTACGVVQTPPITSGVSIEPIQQDVLRAGAVVLGNFEDNGSNPLGAPVDELIVAYVSGENPCLTDMHYWSFDSGNSDWTQTQDATVQDLLPQAKSAISVGIHEFVPTINLHAQAAYLDWYGKVEQAVIAANGTQLQHNPADPILDTYASFSTVITASVSGTGKQAQLQACASTARKEDSAQYVWGSAVGRFSTSTTVNPDNPSACGDFANSAPGDCPYNPQISILIATDAQNTESSAPGLWVYTVQPSDPGSSSNSLRCANDTQVHGFLPIRFQTTPINLFSSMPVASLRGGSLLHAGDAFGNSVRVGEPSVTRISRHTQPQIVIQAPPSLVDYVPPAGSATPAIVNFTRAPGNYNAEVDFTTMSTDTASTRQTTSYTSSTSETLSDQLVVDIPVVAQISVKNKESWKQMHEHNTSTQLSTYSTSRLNTRGTIGADDQVWWTQTSFNVFHFPVIGETVCPASIACDAADPNTNGCSEAASGIVLTCDVDPDHPDACTCLSDNATDSLCPLPPGDGNQRACQESGSEESGIDVCCTQLQQQLNLSLSGPEEVTRASGAGATLEWYQPKHEPGQLLSYPPSLQLLEARTPNFDALAELDAFTTGTNSVSETISWTCGTQSKTSVGTTTRHSFESDTSYTQGPDGINEGYAGGAQASFDFDYQSSRALSTLNSYSVGQTASSSVTLNLKGSAFLNTVQYAYSVEGVVLGAVKPTSVLDNPDLKVCPSNDPDCSAEDEVQADCMTTGPLTVAFAADPTGSAGSGLWWQSVAPYLGQIDVALNNPSRWSKVSPAQVADSTLQCRGSEDLQACYTINQPGETETETETETPAQVVWDTLFYNMKGLLVTNGGTAGPLRDTARVGDEIFLQARVYNYSLKDMDPMNTNTHVYARFYRQQVDVNNNNGVLAVADYATDAQGKPLPAVPVGPAGLGDHRPIPVISPEDGSATIPPFNTMSDPALENISIATASYIAAEGDECEYDKGVQSCKGAYYVYWVTVWAQDSEWQQSGGNNVLPELPGHGLPVSGIASFDPSAIYNFIIDVPLETVAFNNTPTTFSNNVGMFKKVFIILPANSPGAPAGAAPGELAVERLNVTPERTVLGRPVVVSAQVVSGGAPTNGVTVVFSDGDPGFGGEVFDTEWLPYIRADDAHFTRASFNPETCGTHELFVEVAAPRGAGSIQSAGWVDVGIDIDRAIAFLIAEVEGLDLGFPVQAELKQKQRLIRELQRAQSAFNGGDNDKGVFHLRKFNDQVESFQRRGRIAPDKAEALIAQADRVIGCAGF